MNILALDLGTKCGWAVAGDYPQLETFRSGLWKLAPSRFDSKGQRFVNFEREVRSHLEIYRIKTIVFEEVRNHRAIDAAHIYGGMVAVLQTVAIKNGMEYRGVPVGTIKKFATGRGNADKGEMVKAANRLYPSVNVIDDNHADALCLLSWALSELIY